ncbi:hypothetical protein [Vibrio owensii]|uniref:hypothetical protein n=1 Tax=Vibrio owensii TaxID=696485 RepID=UPI003CC62494
MAENTTATNRGRKALSPLERARNTLIKAIHEKEEVSQEYDLNFDLEGYSQQEIDSIKLNANCRLSIARKIDEISVKIKELGTSNPDAEDLKEQRSDLQTELHEMAPLGMSHEDWEESREISLLEPGRKRLEIEYRYNRANDAFDEALQTYRQLEAEAGVGPVDIDKISKMKVTTSTSGRPKADAAFRKLDREHERYKKNYLQAIEEAESYVENPNARGRKKIHPIEKAKTYFDKMCAIIQSINLEEDKLSVEKLLERAKGQNALAIKRVSRAIDAEDAGSHKEELENELSALQARQELIVNELENPSDGDISWAKTEMPTSDVLDEKLKEYGIAA